MSSKEYNEDHLPDLLPLYYKRLFPYSDFFKWLCYGRIANFQLREISFTLIGDVYLRYLSYVSEEEFTQALFKKYPLKLNIGAVYNGKPQSKSTLTTAQAVEKELVFDIDLTDYDEVRTCCSGADACLKCWKFMSIACKILDIALREDFGFKCLLWVFSGRRGIHCWIADIEARKLTDSSRSAVAEYLQVLKGTNGKKAHLPYEIHSSIRRALGIIDNYFLEHIVIGQDILGSDERLRKFISMIDASLQRDIKNAMEACNSSEERWKAFENEFARLLRYNKVSKRLTHLIEEMKLHYAYPRIDIHVTTAVNHLLKAPFCVHPKTGKISTPFNPKFVDSFDLNTVPTITQLVDEVNAYDAKTKEQDQSSNENTTRIKDYKKTSLLKYINVFKEFLRDIDKHAISLKNDTAMDF